MGSPYGPATGLVTRLGALPQKALNTVTHPLDALREMLGISEPAPAPMQQADPQMVRDANASFVHPPEPASALPRRKPAAKSSGE